MLPTFQERYPKVRVILSVDNRNVDLLTEEIDVAIRIGPLADSGLIARRLATFELWPCASPAYLADRGLPNHPDGLAGHAIIAHASREKVWRFGSRQGPAVIDVELASIAVVPEPAVAKTMLIGGAGIA